MEEFIMKAINTGFMRKFAAVCMMLLLVVSLAAPASAAEVDEISEPVTTEVVEEQAEDTTTGTKAMAAAIVVSLAAAAGAIAMGMAITKSVDGISRQPEAEGQIRTTLMLGLVFIETAIIYALIVAILIIFVM